MAFYRCFHLLIFVPALILQVRGDSACMDNRNPAACFEGLRALLRNTSAFWYGSDYQALCPQGPSSEDPLCVNDGDPAVADSIASRMLGNQSYDLSTIDTILNVSFESPPGPFYGCGNEFRSTQMERFDLDPLSPELRSPWSLRMTPTVTWEAEPGRLYTLLVYDVGPLILHGLYININGSVMTDGQAVVPYRGPGNPLPRPNSYVFALFTHDAPLDAAAAVEFYVNSTQRGYNFLSSEFISKFPLQGPLAVNLMLAPSDGFSVGRFQRLNLGNFCPYLLKDVLDMRRFSFAQPFSPRASVNVSFQSQAIRYQVCCQDYDYPATNVTLNPLGMMATESVFVRSTPSVSIQGIKRNYVNGKLFTLMLVDAKPEMDNSSNTALTVHWQVVNIPDGSVGSGEELLSYVGARQWGMSGQHMLVYILLEQTNGRLNTSVPPTYAGNCMGALAGRCEYRVESFIQENGLKLVGANWQTVANDAYVRHLELASGRAESVVCRGVSGYASPCPVSRAPSPALSLSLLLGLAVLALLASL